MLGESSRFLPNNKNGNARIKSVTPPETKMAKIA